MGQKEFLHLTPDEAEQYVRIVDGALAQLDRLDELVPPPVRLRHQQRDPGYVPSPEEDPYHAFIRMCRVEGSPGGPLAGTRLGVKDNLAVAGIPVTNSSRTLSFTPTADAVVVERLLDAGSSVVGKLNLDDFSTSGTGESSFYGPARNPVDPSRSSGGSSGGSGSAVASGAVDIAIGVDQGGSARIPASFCGVVSLKATHGLIPSHGVSHIDHTIDYVCPMARTIELTAKAADVMAGSDWRDPQWGPRGSLNSSCVDEIGRDVKGLRIGIVKESTPDGLCQPAVLAAFEDACAALEAEEAQLVPVSIPLWTESWSIALGIIFHASWAMAQSEGMGFGHNGLIDGDRAHGFALMRRLEADDFPPFFKTWLLVGRYLHDEYFSTYFAKAQNLRIGLRQQVESSLDDCDLLITPTTPHVAPTLLDRPGTDEELLARGTTMVYNTAPLNLSGHPALALPSGRDDTGMPTSVQIIARPYDDALTIRAGAIVEAAVLQHLSIPA
jgi:amidase